MHKTTLITFVLTLFVALTSWAQFPAKPQLAKDPWSRTDLMAPASLAAMIKNSKSSKPGFAATLSGIMANKYGLSSAITQTFNLL